MGFFRKLLGMESAAEIETEANGLFEKGEFGLAKLRYENVLDKLGAEASDADRERVKGRITAARNAIADQRLVEGERLLVHGVEMAPGGEQVETEEDQEERDGAQHDRTSCAG